MLHFENLAPTLGTVPSSALFQGNPNLKNVSNKSAPLIKVSFRTVELDGQNLWREPEDVVVGQLAEAIRLADRRDMTELKINNIAPWIAVGDADSCQVPILQKKIQQKLEIACERVKRPMPECRLDLSHGDYGIRCYLGRIKPTDHVYEEDFVSDSR